MNCAPPATRTMKSARPRSMSNPASPIPQNDRRLRADTRQGGRRALAPRSRYGSHRRDGYRPGTGGATNVASACCTLAVLPGFRGTRYGATEAGVRFLGWMAQEACQRADPELFSPIVAGDAGLSQISAAKAICQGCAVRDPACPTGWRPGRTASGEEPPWTSAAPSAQQADLPRHASPGPRQVPSL